MSLENTVACDAETNLFSAGNLAPPLVCVSTCGFDLEPKLYHWSDSFEVLRDLFRNKNIVGQNFSYDSAVFAAQFPELLPDIFQAYFDGRIIDTRLCERLIDIARGQLDFAVDGYGNATKRYYSLDALSQRYGHGKLDKTTWRTGYGELRHLPLNEWPEGAREYAKHDALVTLKVSYSQLEYSAFLEDSAAQARAAFALHLMSCRGIITDARACDRFIELTRQEIERAKALLQARGLVDSKGKRSMLKTRDYMVKTCNGLGIPVPMTKKSKDAKDGWEPSVCLDAEACRDTGDELLMAYSTYTSANTLLKKAELLKLGSTGTPLQTQFEPLLETGRTSSRAPSPPLVGDNFQNIRKATGMRECFVPRPGYVLGSIDYDMAELRTVSQIYLWLFGQSKLADALNNDRDVHCVIAAELMGRPYEEVLANKKVGDYKKNRDFGKMGNFSLWGGSGVKTFVAAVNAGTTDKSKRIDEGTGHRIKAAWTAAWEPKPYFDWIQKMIGEGQATYKSWISGRIRANLNYTTAANHGFQALAADAAKSSLLPLAHECYSMVDSPLYGSRPLLFIHDEVLFEFREDRAHEAAFRARDIMVDCFNRYTPDVPVTAEPCLMRQWSKAAESVYVNGELVPWEAAA